MQVHRHVNAAGVLDDLRNASLKAIEVARSRQRAFGKDAHDIPGGDRGVGGFERANFGLDATTHQDRFKGLGEVVEDFGSKVVAVDQESNVPRQQPQDQDPVDVGNVVGNDHDAAGRRQMLQPFDASAVQRAEDGPEDAADE